MRQITVLMPAEKAALDLILRERTRTGALALHEIAHARIVGRAGQSLRLHTGKGKCDTRMSASLEGGHPGRSSFSTHEGIGKWRNAPHLAGCCDRGRSHSRKCEGPPGNPRSPAPTGYFQSDLSTMNNNLTSLGFGLGRNREGHFTDSSRCAVRGKTIQQHQGEVSAGGCSLWQAAALLEQSSRCAQGRFLHD